MLWWNTTYKNETLEKIFTDKNNNFYYKLYDTYYEKKAKENLIKKTTSLDINTISLDDIKLNIKTDHLSTFKEHYNNFKPTYILYNYLSTEYLDVGFPTCCNINEQNKVLNKLNSYQTRLLPLYLEIRLSK